MELFGLRAEEKGSKGSLSGGKGSKGALSSRPLEPFSPEAGPSRTRSAQVEASGDAKGSRPVDENLNATAPQEARL